MHSDSWQGIYFVKHPLEDHIIILPPIQSSSFVAKAVRFFFVLPLILYFVSLSLGFRNYILQTVTGTS